MKLYTSSGDEGETSLFDGTRVSKDDRRVDAYGDVDELNAVLGWCRVAVTGAVAGRLAEIQSDLLAAGAELATPADSKAADRVTILKDEDVKRLEAWIDESAAITPPLHRFILPGGSEAAARLHVARTCCRRTERAVVALSHSTPVRREIMIYFNRLGDLLFAWARQANREAGIPDTEWTPSR